MIPGRNSLPALSLMPRKHCSSSYYLRAIHTSRFLNHMSIAMAAYSQEFEKRYARLTHIAHLLENSKSRLITRRKQKRLKIHLNPLDINSGRTSSTVFPYFLPRTGVSSIFDLKHDSHARDAFLQCQGKYNGFKDWMHGTEDSQQGMEWRLATKLERAYYRYREECLSVDERKLLRKKNRLEGNESIRQKEYPRYKDAWSKHPTHEERHWLGSVKIDQSGDDGCPSTTEVLVLVMRILNGMAYQHKWNIDKKDPELKSGCAPKKLFHMYPTMIVTIDPRGKARVLWAYFDGTLHVQFSRLLDFGQFAIQPPSGKRYLNCIDVRKYFEMMDILVKWAWPVIQGDTTRPFALPPIAESSDED
ncbi:hypothetical protein ASPZODRAFT_2109743 [Penicilliopsis zonata CBS 506.65]|uniref:Uncharacterized protein n=1 Tax=Penicilliopsis zonata CBS 506.65 TaxID=1073090 RepID=A0A1L9SE20_9EURO|nr:hypothetical protein ASPZODRAFT_2109743 [Penicilliopsis zonata CBS 506.65]OJJ45353.1 hypothetical protein ASPZODRAFT_2109743 [Penicilliopsis zonata CBS 506.65]